MSPPTRQAGPGQRLAAAACASRARRHRARPPQPGRHRRNSLSSAKRRAGCRSGCAQDKAKAVTHAPQVKALGVTALHSRLRHGRWDWGGAILPKAETEEQAADCLWLLSGRAHWVYSAVCLIDPKGTVRTALFGDQSSLQALFARGCRDLLKSGEWRGKAGGYAIQGRAEVFVRALTGSHSGVVGLPLYETIHLLQGAGYPVYYHWMASAAG